MKERTEFKRKDDYKSECYYEIDEGSMDLVKDSNSKYKVVYKQMLSGNKKMIEY